MASKKPNRDEIKKVKAVTIETGLDRKLAEQANRDNTSQSSIVNSLLKAFFAKQGK